MSSSSALETEDLENVPLVRMEDVQPARNKIVDQIEVLNKDQVYETCIIDGDDFATECLNETEDIGSMVSIKSEGVVDSDDAEYIVPEVQDCVQTTVVSENVVVRRSPPDSWPTLEILPGGVIRHADQYDEYNRLAVNEVDLAEMYACAKCSQSFKCLYNLVKHVKTHSDEQKKLKSPDLGKSKNCDKRCISVNAVRKKIVISKPARKRKPKKKS